MLCRVHLRLPDDSTVVLGHGDFIGRLWNAALILDDARVSEAHALVSLRGHEVKLLGLRGRFAVDGKPLAELTLRVGQRIAFADGVAVEVLAVHLPERVLGLSCEGMPLRAIPGTCALLAPAHGPPSLAPPAHPEAIAHVWAVEDGWRVRPAGGLTQPLLEGADFFAGGLRWSARYIGLGGQEVPSPTVGRLDLPLHVVARYDTVHVFQEGQEPAFLNGLPARLLSELVAMGAPVPWAVLCQELWGPDGSRKQLDMALVRLRRKLREQGVRPDLVRTDGAGNVELFLRPGDRVEDQA